MLDFAVDYSRSGMMMEVETWQYIGLIPKQQSYYLKPVKFASSERMGEGYCCNCTHSMVAVTSDGEIMPCNQMSGYFLKNGISMGTVRRTPLRDLLGGGTYVRAANMTVHDLGNSACGTCRHFGYCGGGCRALGLLYSGGRELAGLTCCPPGLQSPPIWDRAWDRRGTQDASPARPKAPRIALRPHNRS